MDPLIYDAILSPILEFVTTLAFLALVAAPLVYLNIREPKAVKRFKDKTPWMGWTEKDEDDPYFGFTIHPSNYIKVPSSR